MAHIKEPKGVDFIIQSEPLTDEARQEISAFIKGYKAKNARSATRVKTNRTKQKAAVKT